MTYTPDLPGFRPGAVIVLVGAPGAGKSTYAAAFPRTWVVNLDTYRALITDDPSDQSATGEAVQIQNIVLAGRLRRGLSSVIDSTNVNNHIRTELMGLARRFAVPALAVVFDTPLQECLRRNVARPRPVPDSVVREKHALLPSREHLRAEGFAAVHVIPANTALTGGAA